MSEIKIKALPDGPYLITGSGQWTNSAGETVPVQGKGMALCRCGQSASRPICDGSHKSCGFTSPAADITVQTG